MAAAIIPSAAMEAKKPHQVQRALQCIRLTVLMPGQTLSHVEVLSTALSLEGYVELALNPFPLLGACKT